MTPDTRHAAHDAEQARRIMEDPILVAALDRLETEYLGRWRNSLPEDQGSREDAYHALRGLEAFRRDLSATISAPDFLARQKRRAD